MIRMVRNYVKKHNMFQIDDSVLLGISGGADSVCLFFVLLELREEYHLHLEAVHVHHGIRGEEADEDVEFVRKLCESHEILLHVVKKNVPEEAKVRHMGEEEAGRAIRYEAFDRIAEEQGVNKIAVAHHALDQAETILFHLCRGSGLLGLGGMKPVSRNIVRPLLFIEKQQIYAYLNQKGIGWRCDSSNDSNQYMRNRIRNQVVPILESLINTKSISHIVESGDMILEAYSYIRGKAKLIYDRISRKEADGILILDGLWKEEGLIQKEVLRMAVEQCAKSLKDISRQHIEFLQELGQRDVGKQVELPCGLKAERTYDGIWIGFASFPKQPENKTIVFDNMGSYQILEANFTIRLTLFKEMPQGLLKDLKQNTENDYTKWMDYDKIKGILELRTRQSGDYIILEENAGKKKLKKYFIDEKVPSKNRDSIWLLADGNHILWIIGYRMSGAVKITKETTHVLQITVDGGDKSAR